MDGPSTPSQLFQCVGPTLGDSLLKANPHVTSQPLEDLLLAMRSPAVIPVATYVLCTKLLQMHQEWDEAFCTFSTQVCAKCPTHVKPFSTVSLPMLREEPGQSYPYPIPSGSE